MPRNNQEFSNLPQPLADLVHLLQQNSDVGPSALIGIEQPKNPDGFWWLDYSTKAGRADVQWSERNGFGVSTWTPDDDPLKGAFEGPEHTAATPQEAFEKIQTVVAANIAGPGSDMGLD